MIILPEDKKIIEHLPPEDARQVLLAIFSEEDDLPEMSPFANAIYIMLKEKNERVSTGKATRGRNGGAPTGNQNAKKQSKQSTEATDCDEEINQSNQSTEAENQSNSIKTNNDIENNQKQATVTGTESESVTVTVTVTESDTDSIPPTPLAGGAPDGAASDEAVEEVKKPKKRRKAKTVQAEDIDFDALIEGYTENQTLREALKNYVQMRRAKGKLPPTAHAMDLVWKHLGEYSEGSLPTMLQILEKSIIEGWTDIYALRPGINGSARGQPDKRRFQVGSINQDAETPDQRKARFDRLIE